MDWKTIETKRVKNVEDFNFYGIYRFARNNTDYELMLLSTIAGIENSYVVREVRSEFDGMYLIGNDGLFGTVYDLDGCDTTRNTTASIVNLLNNRGLEHIDIQPLILLKPHGRSRSPEGMVRNQLIRG